MKRANVRTVLVAVLVVGSVLVYALRSPGGKLDPSGKPAPTMRTLDEIYSSVNALAAGACDETAGGLTYIEKLKLEPLITWGSSSVPYLKLQINGNDIEGESTITSMDREGTIECQSFDHEIRVPYDPVTFAFEGRRIHGAVSIIKRTDKTSPLLYKALCLNEPVTKAEFRFYRPNPVFGAEEHYSTVLLENGYVVGIRRSFPNVERVTFIYQDITWTYEIGGATHKDSARP